MFLFSISFYSFLLRAITATHTMASVSQGLLSLCVPFVLQDSHPPLCICIFFLPFSVEDLTQWMGWEWAEGVEGAAEEKA